MINRAKSQSLALPLSDHVISTMRRRTLKLAAFFALSFGLYPLGFILASVEGRIAIACFALSMQVMILCIAVVSERKFTATETIAGFIILNGVSPTFLESLPDIADFPDKLVS
jgi:hypothetical protein